MYLWSDKFHVDTSKNKRISGKVQSCTGWALFLTIVQIVTHVVVQTELLCRRLLVKGNRYVTKSWYNCVHAILLLCILSSITLISYYVLVSVFQQTFSTTLKLMQLQRRQIMEMVIVAFMTDFYSFHHAQIFFVQFQYIYRLFFA